MRRKSKKLLKRFKEVFEGIRLCNGEGSNDGICERTVQQVFLNARGFFLKPVDHQ